MVEPHDETFQLVEGKPHSTESGLQFTLKGGWTIYTVEGGHFRDYELEIAKGSEKFTVKCDGEKLYVEGVAFGQLYFISESDEGVRVMLSPKAPTPLSERQAVEMAKKEAKNRGLEVDTGYSYRVGVGTLHISFLGERSDRPPVGRFVVGLYTGKILDFLTEADAGS